jgi:hypothetical protein
MDYMKIFWQKRRIKYVDFIAGIMQQDHLYPSLDTKRYCRNVVDALLRKWKIGIHFTYGSNNSRVDYVTLDDPGYIRDGSDFYFSKDL